jgi:hypothetical protein
MMVEDIYSCGNSCVLSNPKGPATNGPCHCLDGLAMIERYRVGLALLTYRDALRGKAKPQCVVCKDEIENLICEKCQ